MEYFKYEGPNKLSDSSIEETFWDQFKKYQFEQLGNILIIFNMMIDNSYENNRIL